MNTPISVILRFALLVILPLFPLGEQLKQIPTAIPAHTGGYRTQLEYFKHWYSPYEEWPAELQRSAYETILEMSGDNDIPVIGKRGQRTTAATQPWVQKGPVGMEDDRTDPNAFWSGRVTCLAYNPDVGLWVGAANGGVWRYKASVFTYIPIADNLPTLSIGGIALHPENPYDLYVGTGDYERGRGTGVYRSTNDGAVWTLMPLSPTPTRISKVIIAPWSSAVVFVSSWTGIYRSSDGGATWSVVLNKNVSDLATSPTGTFMLAGVQKEGLYRSSDFGVTWTQLTTDLPSSGVGRVAVSISQSSPVIACAQIGDINADDVLGVYRTTNSGANWSDITPPVSALTGGKTKYLGQQRYNNVITINPTNPNIIWAGGVFTMRSGNGGSTWTNIGATGAGPRKVHPDIHVLFYSSPTRLYVGCDGGVVVTDDEGDSWAYNINRRLPITMFYNIGVEYLDGRVKYGGTQDNGLTGTTTSLPDVWIHRVQGDGIDASVNNFDARIVHGTINGSNKVWRWRTTNDGANWGGANNGVDPNHSQQDFWNTYISTDPSFSDRVYSNAGYYMYWSTNKGVDWSIMGSSSLGGRVGQMDVNSNGSILYAPVRYPIQGTKNFISNLWKYTYVGGSSPWSISNTTANLPLKLIKKVVTSISSPIRAYVVYSGVGDNEKIFRTTNSGTTWTNITGNLPDVPINDVLEDQFNQNRIWAATDNSVFMTLNGGSTWYKWTAGMPIGTQVMDLEYTVRLEGKFVVAGTYGRSTFERPVAGTDPIFLLPFAKFLFPSLRADEFRRDSFYVFNRGEDDLEISSVESNNDYITVRPNSALIAAAESLRFYISVETPEDRPGPLSARIQFVHNGADSPTILEAEGYVGDATAYRSFPPESLVVKKDIKRKIRSSRWWFNFPNDNTHREPAKALYVEFKKPVLELTSYAPFDSAEKLDKRGKTWMFTGGYVHMGSSAIVCGITKGKRGQDVKKWWWIADLVVWNDDVEESVEGILGPMNGRKSPDRVSLNFPMPNAANFAKETFEQVPFDKSRPLIVGVEDPLARSQEVAYVAIGKHRDVWSSLAPRRNGVQHDGPASSFDYFDKGRKMKGKLRNLKPNKQSNRLFAELLALKMNIYGSAMGKTPIGFGELRYVEPGHRFDRMLVRDIDSIANVFMTYGDSGAAGMAVELDSVLRKINAAFVGPIDTLSFAAKLRFTGVRPVAEVPFLERDSSIVPKRIVPDLTLVDLPEDFELYQNYPNPFNPTTSIAFNLPDDAVVTLKIFNMLGENVATLLDHESMEWGYQEVDFYGDRLSTGVYFYRLTTEAILDDREDGSDAIPAVQTKKMMLLR